MRIRVTFAGWDPHDRLLFRLAGISGAAHLGALILFSILPRFISPMSPPPQATIAELIPASALGLPAAPAARAPQGPTPSQRAAAAQEALKQEKTPPPPKREPPAPKKSREARPDRTTPPLPGARSEAKGPPDPQPEPAATAPAPAEAEEPAGPAGGISFGSAAAGLPGGVPSIGSSAFPYDYYRSILVTLLQSHWRRPVTPEGLAAPISCRVAFTILKSGIVQEPRIVEPSGNAALDQSAIRALYDSSPLPPLPFQYGHGSVGAEVVFELTPE